MNVPFRQPLPGKLRLYEALYGVNRGFEATLMGLDHLERLGMFDLANLNAFKVSLEHIRALTNDEVIRTLQEYEEEESVRFGRMESAWQKQQVDPDDVFFAAKERKEEIRRQIKELQRALARTGKKKRR